MLIDHGARDALIHHLTCLNPEGNGEDPDGELRGRHEVDQVTEEEQLDRREKSFSVAPGILSRQLARLGYQRPKTRDQRRVDVSDRYSRFF